MTCIFFDEAVTLNAGSTFNSIQADCPATDPIDTNAGSTADALAVFNAGMNNAVDVDLVFTNGFFFASAAAASDVTALSTFFVDAPFIGAIDAADDDRFQGWACDSSTLDFGTGSACTTLPIRQGEG